MADKKNPGKARLYTYEYEAEGFAQTDGTVTAANIQEAKDKARMEAEMDGIVSIDALRVRRSNGKQQQG